MHKSKPAWARRGQGPCDGSCGEPSCRSCAPRAEPPRMLGLREVILVSPNGSRWRLTVDNAGALSVVAA